MHRQPLCEDPNYLGVMQAKGNEYWPKIEEALDGNASWQSLRQLRRWFGGMGPESDRQGI